MKGGEGQSDGSEYGGVGGGTQGASCGHACARRECGELGHGQAGHAADAGCLAAHVAGGAPGSCAQAPRADGNDGLLQVAMRRVARNSRLLFPCVDRPATLTLFDRHLVSHSAMHTPGVTTPILESFSNGELPTSFRSSDGRIAGGRPPPPSHPPPACPPHSSHRGGFQGGMMGSQPPGFRQDGRGGFMPGNSRGGYHGAARFDPYGESLSPLSLSQTRAGVNCRCRCACASPRTVTTLPSPAMLPRRRQHLPVLPLWCAPDSRDMTAVAHAHATAGRGRGSS